MSDRGELERTIERRYVAWLFDHVRRATAGAKELNERIKRGPGGRELAVVRTKLDEARLWLGELERVLTEHSAELGEPQPAPAPGAGLAALPVHPRRSLTKQSRKKAEAMPKNDTTAVDTRDPFAAHTLDPECADFDAFGYLAALEQAFREGAPGIEPSDTHAKRVESAREIFGELHAAVRDAAAEADEDDD